MLIDESANEVVTRPGEDTAVKIAKLGTCMLLGVPRDTDFFVEVFSPSAGYKRVLVDRSASESGEPVAVVLDAKPERKEVCVLDREGNPVDDATFEIPVYSEAYRESKEAVARFFARFEPLRDEDFDLLHVRPGPKAGCFTLRLYPGEGSVLRVSSAKSGSVTVPADEVIERGVVILE